MPATSLLLTASRQIRDQFYPAEAVAALAALGDLRLNEGDAAWDAETLIRHAQGCAIVVADRQTPAPAALFANCPDLVALVRTAVDISNVAVDAASAHGVLVTHATPGFASAVAELAIGGMIDLARRITESTIAFRAGETPPVTLGTQLDGSVLGVIGYGVIGRRLCALGQALGMEVLVADPHVAATEPGIAQTELPDLLARADFVACMVVATPETENLMDAAAFARMKRGAFFVNAARGGPVDEQALAAALDAGHLGGAALDVGRAPDQMPSPALAAHPRVVATPHIGGLTPKAVAHQALESAAQCAAIVAGEIPPGAVNADRATRLAAARAPTGSDGSA